MSREKGKRDEEEEEREWLQEKARETKGFLWYQYSITMNVKLAAQFH